MASSLSRRGGLAGSCNVHVVDGIADFRGVFKRLWHDHENRFLDNIASNPVNSVRAGFLSAISDQGQVRARQCISFSVESAEFRQQWCQLQNRFLVEEPMSLVRCALFIAILLAFLAAASPELSGTAAQQYNRNLYQSLRWRCIGPFRAGRTVGATGVPGQPNVFYIGVNNGGVWKTNDYGHTWQSIFDDQ